MTRSFALCACAAVALACCAACDLDTAPRDPAKDGGDDDATVSFYERAVVQDIDLTIAQSDVDAMNSALPDEIDVPATFTWHGAAGDVVVRGGGVRYKGDSSAIAGVDMQRSL